MKVDELDSQAARVETGMKIRAKIDSLRFQYKQVSDGNTICIFLHNGVCSTIRVGSHDPNCITDIGSSYDVLDRKTISEMLDLAKQPLLNKLACEIKDLEDEFTNL